MNTITKQKPNPQTGDIFEKPCGGTYILGEFNFQHFLVNLETGSTWNGFKRNIQDVFSGSDFKLVRHPIKLTPEIE